jgi:hypothetical protein
MDLPSDMTKLIASYIKPIPYDKMTDKQLQETYDAICTEKKRREQFNHDTSEYLLIRAIREDEIVFKINNTECRDITKYKVTKTGRLWTDEKPFLGVIDAIDIRPGGIPIPQFTQFWTYGQLKWVDYSLYKSKFDL